MMCTCLKKRWKCRKVSVGCGGSSADSQNVSSRPCLQKRKPGCPGRPLRPGSVLLPSEQGAGAAAGAGVALPRPPGKRCRGGLGRGPQVTGWPRAESALTASGTTVSSSRRHTSRNLLGVLPTPGSRDKKGAWPPDPHNPGALLERSREHARCRSLPPHGTTEVRKPTSVGHSQVRGEDLWGFFW